MIWHMAQHAMQGFLPNVQASLFCSTPTPNVQVIMSSGLLEWFPGGRLNLATQTRTSLEQKHLLN